MMASLQRTRSATRENKLTAALQRDLEMDPVDAEEIAAIVVSTFQGRDELDDREIGCDLRSVFYELEEHKLLEFRRETYQNEEGHKRRAFFWTIRWDEVEPDELDEGPSNEHQPTVYDELPQNAWSRASEA